MSSRDRGIEEIVSRAIQAGAFDNLKGQGKPLNLETNPHVEPGWQLAYDLLKQNNFAPDWVEARQEIEIELAQARDNLTRTNAWREEALERGEQSAVVSAEWQQAQTNFRQAVEEINTKIDAYNLIIPLDRLYRSRVDVERELEKIIKRST